MKLEYMQLRHGRGHSSLLGLDVKRKGSFIRTPCLWLRRDIMMLILLVDVVKEP